MWLLNVRTRKLEEYVSEEEKYGRYAILSHVWEDEEVTFQDIWNGIAEQRAGYAKIEHTCQRAEQDKLDFVWIDTCCIDKTSSAELSQAINSMYRWYYQAKVCYAYLYDVPTQDFMDSKWFTRGWCLQELIAPGFLEFYDAEWKPIGTKISRVPEISEVTGIDSKVLRDRDAISTMSVASRMAWAANRKTSREEDWAYSLMGIFDVNMPMLYGEGPKAFGRLQEEIIKNSTDHSILVWQAWKPGHDTLLLAPSPYGFRRAHNIMSWTQPGIDESFILSNKGLRISLPILESMKNPTLLTAVLNCRYSDNTTSQIALFLHKQPRGMIVPTRNFTSLVCAMSSYPKPDGTLTSIHNLERHKLPSAKWHDLMILREPPQEQTGAPAAIWNQKISIRNNVNQLNFIRVHPEEAWDPVGKTITLVMTGSREHDSGYIVLSERDDKYKFILVFCQTMNSGTVEPRICLSRSTTLPSSPRALDTTHVAKKTKTEFKKGVSELVASIERNLSATGELEWIIKISLELSPHASTTSFKNGLSHLVGGMHIAKTYS